MEEDIKKKKISENIIKALELAKKVKCRTISILGRKNGYAATNSNISIILPNVDKKLITPFAETTQVLIWHLLVSHPELKKKVQHGKFK